MLQFSELANVTFLEMLASSSVSKTITTRPFPNTATIITNQLKSIEKKQFQEKDAQIKILYNTQKQHGRSEAKHLRYDFGIVQLQQARVVFGAFRNVNREYIPHNRVSKST